MWTKAILNSKYAIKEEIIVNNTENIALSALSNFWPREIWEDKSHDKTEGLTVTIKWRFQIYPA